MRDNDLIAATHGRSFWMIDDLTPLHELNKNISVQEFHIFKPDIAYRIYQSNENEKINYQLVTNLEMCTLMKRTIDHR